MGISIRVERWACAHCDVCGAASPEWREVTFENEDGPQPDPYAQTEQAVAFGWTMVGVHRGPQLMACRPCRAAILARQVAESESTVIA